MKISESNMEFGDYPDDNVFYLEQNEQYKKIKGNGVKCCEFIFRKDNDLYFIEAKSSCPQQIAENSSEERKRKYNEYISDITTKFRHSLEFYSSVLLERFDEIEISDLMKPTNLRELKLKPVLVINGAEKGWLPPLKEKLNSVFKSEKSIWNFSDIFVINEQQAKSKNFIL